MALLAGGALVPGVAGSEYNYLDGVAATSQTNAWAVGYFNNFGGLDRTMALHWNGTAWGP